MLLLKFLHHSLVFPGQRNTNLLWINLLSFCDNNRLAKVRLFFELANYFCIFFQSPILLRDLLIPVIISFHWVSDYFVSLSEGKSRRRLCCRWQMFLYFSGLWKIKKLSFISVPAWAKFTSVSSASSVVNYCHLPKDSLSLEASVKIELIPFARINALLYHAVQFSFIYLQSLNGKATNFPDRHTLL